LWLIISSFNKPLSNKDSWNINFIDNSFICQSLPLTASVDIKPSTFYALNTDLNLLTRASLENSEVHWAINNVTWLIKVFVNIDLEITILCNSTMMMLISHERFIVKYFWLKL
jgi:hypothetical protein